MTPSRSRARRRAQPLPTVTALVAAYNYGGLIARTLDSALTQDYPPELLDIVVVDDGSSDDTPAVLADYAHRHPGRVTVIRQPNSGYVAATNRAVASARGEMLAILDADDLWPAAKTRRQVERLREDERIGLVYSDTEIIDPYDRVRRPSLWRWHSMTPQRGAEAFPAIMATQGNVALASTIMLRASLAAHAFPMPLAAPYVDWWVTARIAAIAHIDYLEDVRVGYRQHGENLTLGATGMQRVRETLKCAEVRRQLLLHDAADHLDETQLLAAFKAWEGAALTAVQQAGSAYLPLPVPAERERELGAAHARAAEAALCEGDVREAFRRRVSALACDPMDASSREWVHELSWIAADEPQDPVADPLAHARAFVTLAHVDELAAEPELLGAYAAVVDADDDATLAVAAIGMGADRATQAVLDIAARAGISPASLPDVLVVNGGGPATRVELERRADAVLTRRRARMSAPTFPPERVHALRERIGPAPEPVPA